MPLDPQAQKLLDTAKASGLPPVNQVSVEEARARMAKALTYTGEPEPIASVEDLFVPTPDGSLRVRHYRPTTTESQPAAIFFHGGGWVLNNLNTHDHLCRALANRSGCAIIAADYRLAPEHPYPAAIDDAWSVTHWVFDQAKNLGIDPRRVGLVGDSSGGTQAAVVAQIARNKGGPKLACQALIYPVLDHWTVGTGSYREMGTGYSLSRDLMVWFWQHYITENEELNNPRICPLRDSHFVGLPPTLVLTAEFDPLRDEGEEYVRRLQAAGVPAKASRYDGMMHGFVIQFRILDKGQLGLAETAEFLRKHLCADV